MFALDVSVWEKLLRTTFLYIFLVVALRLSGKREMAQLTTMDFVVLLLVSNAVQNGLIGNDNSVAGAFVGAAALLAINSALVIVLFRHRRLRTLFGGASSVLVRDGQVDQRAMKRERFTQNDLMIELQSAGVTDVSDVALAKLEPNGQLLVSRVDAQYPTTRDLLETMTANHVLLQQELTDLRAQLGRSPCDGESQQ